MLLEMLLAQLLAPPAPAADALAAPSPPPADVCPAGTKLVEGMHWDTVQRLCTTYEQGHCYAFVPSMLEDLLADPSLLSRALRAAQK